MILTLASALLLMQQPAPAPLPSFLLFGANAGTSTTPKPGGFAAYGTPIASDKESWSEYGGSILMVNHRPAVTTSATTGIGQRVLNLTLGSAPKGIDKRWHVQGWINGALGPGTVGSSTSLALNASGGITIYRQDWKRLFGWAGYQQQQVAGKSGGQVQIAWGFRL